MLGEGRGGRLIHGDEASLVWTFGEDQSRCGGRQGLVGVLGAVMKTAGDPVARIDV